MCCGHFRNLEASCWLSGQIGQRSNSLKEDWLVSLWEAGRKWEHYLRPESLEVSFVLFVAIVICCPSTVSAVLKVTLVPREHLKDGDGLLTRYPQAESTHGNRG